MVYAAPHSDAQPRASSASAEGEEEEGKVSAAAPSMDWRGEMTTMAPQLRAFAWSLCHNSADADDLVQETLIKAWTHRERFEPGTNLRAWLFTILRNTYYTSVVRRRREVADEDGKHAARLSSPPTQDWSLAVHTLRVALAELPDEHREALILVGAAGLTYEETAEICQCALGTIKSRVNRARARLLRLMNADEAMDALAPGLEAAEAPGGA
jgi:RNA polymerase sigma-70 factor, ECF subfamily